MFGYTGYKKAGFTLGEVLITIGVIGVVAAMTIPNLSFNYQKKVAGTKLKRAFAVATSACEQMLIQENVYSTKQTDLYSKLSVSSSTASDVNNIIKTYFNTMKDGESTTSGWTIYLPDDTILYIYAYSDGSFVFKTQPQKNKTTYEFVLNTNCSYRQNWGSAGSNAFQSVVDNDWQIP